MFIIVDGCGVRVGVSGAIFGGVNPADVISGVTSGLDTADLR